MSSNRAFLFIPSNLISCSSYSCVVPQGVFPRSKHFSCCPGIWIFTSPSWCTEPGMKSSLQFCLSALCLTPAWLQDSLPHSFWLFCETGMWPDKAVMAYLLSSFLFFFFLFFQNWVLDAKCIYSQWITFPIESFPAVTCAWYLLISTLFLHTVNYLQFRTFLRALLRFINHDHNKYSMHIQYIKLKISRPPLDLHRTMYDILPVEVTYLAFGDIFLNYFLLCLRLGSCHLAYTPAENHWADNSIQSFIMTQGHLSFVTQNSFSDTW